MQRRTVLCGGAVGLLAAALPWPALAHPGHDHPPAGPWVRAIEPLDLVIGSPDAPIEVVEYASLTCGHCAHFHGTVAPGLKREFVDTGRAVWVYRDFPLDQMALGAALLSHAGSPSSAERIRRIGQFFEGQLGYVEQAQRQTILAALQRYGSEIGLSPDAITAVLRDQGLMAAVRASADRGVARGVTFTPTIFINGRLQTPPAGGYTLDSLRPALVPARAP